MYIFLQQYWWLVVSLLGAILVFLLFVQGGNSLLFCFNGIIYNPASVDMQTTSLSQLCMYPVISLIFSFVSSLNIVPKYGSL